MASSEPDFLTLLRTLAEHQVRFIVVGGVSAVLQGAPIATFDLDLVHARDPDNVTHLLAALEDLDAYYREQPARKIRPVSSHLSSPGHQLLLTRAGPLDLLGTIGVGHGYEELLQHTIELTVGEQLRVKVLALATVIRMKEEADRDKDRAVLAVLRQTLAEKNNPQPPD
jgi:hypothetical protein